MGQPRPSGRSCRHTGTSWDGEGHAKPGQTWAVPFQGTDTGATIKNAPFLKQVFFFFFTLLTETAFLICQHSDTFLRLFHSLLRNRELTRFQRGLQEKSVSVKCKSTCKKLLGKERGLSASKSFPHQIGGIRESYFPGAVKSFQKHFFPRSPLGSRLL